MFTLKSYAVKVNDGNYYFTDRMKNSIIDHFYGTNFNYSFYPRRDNNDSIEVMPISVHIKTVMVLDLF